MVAPLRKPANDIVFTVVKRVESAMDQLFRRVGFEAGRRSKEGKRDTKDQSRKSAQNHREQHPGTDGIPRDSGTVDNAYGSQLCRFLDRCLIVFLFDEQVELLSAELRPLVFREFNAFLRDLAECLVILLDDAIKG